MPPLDTDAFLELIHRRNQTEVERKDRAWLPFIFPNRPTRFSRYIHPSRAVCKKDHFHFIGSHHRNVKLSAHQCVNSPLMRRNDRQIFRNNYLPSLSYRSVTTDMGYLKLGCAIQRGDAISIHRRRNPMGIIIQQMPCLAISVRIRLPLS